VRALFHDREDAGRRLGRALAARQQREGTLQPPLVLALPRGGVPVAYEVARALGAPLDVLVVRKLGTPGHEELALGAVASGGAEVLNEELVRAMGVSAAALAEVRERELDELARREREYRGERAPLTLAGRTVIVVDDGVATGATVRVAVQALRQAGAEHVTLAVPLAAPDVARRLALLVDDLVCLETPEPFRSVGQWYQRFDQTSDAEVRRALELSAQWA
jgi:predicted phosphoribosyltransferase